MTRKHKHISDCIGQVLTETLTSEHNDSIILVFTDNWSLITAEGDEEWSYMEEHYVVETIRLPAMGYSVEHLMQLGIFDEATLAKFNEKTAADKAKKTAEDRAKYEELKAQFEGGGK